MASGSLRDPNAFPAWFTKVFGELRNKPRAEIGLFLPTDRGKALDRQRLSRQYRASLKKFPLHPHGQIEDEFRIVAEISHRDGMLVVELVAKAKKSQTTEALESWYSNQVF
jgi:RNase P protein component